MKSIVNAEENQKLVILPGDFNGMYLPHESREDSVLSQFTPKS